MLGGVRLRMTVFCHLVTTVGIIGPPFPSLDWEGSHYTSIGTVTVVGVTAGKGFLFS